MALWLYDGMNSKALLCKMSIGLTAARARQEKAASQDPRLQEPRIPRSTFYKYVKNYMKEEGRQGIIQRVLERPQAPLYQHPSECAWSHTLLKCLFPQLLNVLMGKADG
jgi:hypothetical protein